MDDYSGSDPFASGSNNGDFYRNLMNFGMSAMANSVPANAVTTGAALGRAGLQAQGLARENAVARGQEGYYGAHSNLASAEAYKNFTEAQMNQARLKLMPQMLSMFGSGQASGATTTPPSPPMIAPLPDNGTSPSSTSDSNDNKPQESSGMTGPTWSSTAGNDRASVQPQVNYYPRDAAFMPLTPQQSAQPVPQGFVPPGMANQNPQAQSSMYGVPQPSQNQAAAALPMTALTPPGQQLPQQGAQPQFPNRGQQYKAALAMEAMGMGNGLSQQFAPPPGQQYDANGYLIPIQGYNESMAAAEKAKINAQKEAEIKNAAPLAAQQQAGKDWQDFRSEISDSAFHGQAANTTLDEMKLAASTFKPDYLGDIRGDVRGYANAVSNLLPGQQTSDTVLNAFVDMEKNQGTVLRDALKTTFSRITNLDMISTAKTLPSANTPQGALVINASQMQGANDYNNALNRLLTQYPANLPQTKNDFINWANQRLTPDIFMFQRYPAQVQAETLERMKAMPDGQKRIKSLMNQRAYVIKNGLGDIGQIQPEAPAQ